MHVCAFVSLPASVCIHVRMSLCLSVCVCVRACLHTLPGEELRASCHWPHCHDVKRQVVQVRIAFHRACTQVRIYTRTEMHVRALPAFLHATGCAQQQ